MKKNWKEIVKGIFFAAVVLIAGGAVLGYPLIIFWMGLVPLYVSWAVTIMAFGALILGAVNVSGFVPKNWMKRLWLLLAAVGLCCCVYVGFGIYNDSIPVMEDRDGLLYDYVPNQEGTLAVRLEEESTLKFEEPTIRMDGATALYPIYSAFVQAVYPDQVFEPWDYSYDSKDGLSMVTCTGTTMAYERLIAGETDIIFCGGPSQDQLDMAAEAGVELHMTPIGREAFVFFVNSENPVTGLTVEQIQGIYTGEITNWKELGGKWQKIRPYQRAENSGSQSALLRLMEGLPLIEPEEEDRIGGMGGIITQVASYRNHKNAIGFSFRFYSTEMVENDQIRLLALNGVEPTKETIRDGTYPIASNFFAITASPIGEPAPEETNEDLKALIDWILSEQGQWIVDQTGYVGVN